MCSVDEVSKGIGLVLRLETNIPFRPRCWNCQHILTWEHEKDHLWGQITSFSACPERSYSYLQDSYVPGSTLCGLFEQPSQSQVTAISQSIWQLNLHERINAETELSGQHCLVWELTIGGGQEKLSHMSYYVESWFLYNTIMPTWCRECTYVSRRTVFTVCRYDWPQVTVKLYICKLLLSRLIRKGKRRPQRASPEVGQPAPLSPAVGTFSFCGWNTSQDLF